MKTVRLNQISEIIMGQSPNGSSYNSNNRGLPLLNGAADYKGQNFHPKQYTTESTRIAKKGDIIFGIRATIGNFAITDREYCIGRGVTAIRVNETLADKNYVQKAIEIELSRIIHKAPGSTIKGLKKEDITEMSIPLPSLSEQKKIAAILDAADELRQKDKALLEKYNELTQALFLDMFGDPVRNPKGWNKLELKECTSKIGSGSTPKGGKESYQNTGIALIRSLNVYDNEFFYENLARLSDEQAEKLKNVIVEKNDVLFNITGASVCRSTIVPEDVLPARVNQHVSILRPIKNKLHPIYLSHLMISKSTKQQLLMVGSGGGAVMEAITKEQLEKYKIPVPEFKMQSEFAERIKVIEAQRKIAQISAQKSDELFSSLLQKAYKGELV